MTRHLILIALAALGLAVPACRGAGSPPAVAAAEPPPPAVEPELAPGSRLVDPRADAFVRRMSDYLARVQALALEADELSSDGKDARPRGLPEGGAVVGVDSGRTG